MPLLGLYAKIWTGNQEDDIIWKQFSLHPIGVIQNHFRYFHVFIKLNLWSGAWNISWKASEFTVKCFDHWAMGVVDQFCVIRKSQSKYLNCKKKNLFFYFRHSETCQKKSKLNSTDHQHTYRTTGIRKENEAWQISVIDFCAEVCFVVDW